MALKVAIIGAGAAGCFCAVNIKRRYPDAVVEVFERGNRPMAKLSITGGGRCNLTNTFDGVKRLGEAYPRGEKLMKRMLAAFSQHDTIQWFEREGVRLTIQADNCVFPASQDAMQIVGCLQKAMERSGVKLHLNCKITKEDAEVPDAKFPAETRSFPSILKNYDRVIVTTGGSPKRGGLDFLDSLGLEIAEPVPSLFTFNIKDKITELMGAVVEDASLKLAGTKFKAAGPLLITHWGMSGPAILKLSSYAARFLAENEYRATLLVNWLGDEHNEATAQELLAEMIRRNPHKLASSVHPENITSRLWLHIINKCNIGERRLGELGKKQQNVLAATLVNDQYRVEGKCRFKDEFVTCGGVALSNININTLEAKNHPGLFFAGEVLDVDAITGGFNLQAAWSMGWVIAKTITEEKAILAE